MQTNVIGLHLGGLCSHAFFVCLSVTKCRVLRREGVAQGTLLAKRIVLAATRTHHDTLQLVVFLFRKTCRYMNESFGLQLPCFGLDDTDCKSRDAVQSMFVKMMVHLHPCACRSTGKQFLESGACGSFLGVFGACNAPTPRLTDCVPAKEES
jgi:hypothetical protein